MSTINHDAAKRRFTTEVEGQTGELDYTLSGSVMNITRTLVPPAIGGRGVAAELMGAALKAAQEQHWSVNAVCSYAVAYLKRHSQSRAQELKSSGDEARDKTFPTSNTTGGSS